MRNNLGEKPRILFVDDNISLLTTTAMILKYKGYSITTAKNGTDALQLFREGDFRIVFLDVRMPEMNGIEVYKELKKIDPDVFVILMTAYSDKDLIEVGFKAGVHTVLHKPLEMDDVIAIIEGLRQQKDTL